MNTRKFVAFTLVFLVISSCLLFAKVDVGWYRIDYDQSSDLVDGRWEITWNGSEIYLGYIHFNRIAPWHAAPDPYDPNLVLVVHHPAARLEMVHVQNPDITIPIKLRMGFSGTTTGTHIVQTSPYTVNLRTNWYTGANMTIVFPEITGDDSEYEGHYSSYLNFNVYTSDGQLLAQEQYNLIAYYKSKSPGFGWGVMTNLFLERYAAAGQIDIPLMEQNLSASVVGAVTFMSNDPKKNSRYFVKFSPAEDSAGVFAFHKTSGVATPAQYKVYINGRTTPTNTAFSVPVTTKGPAGYWQDRMEIGISSMNLNHAPLTAGTYTSTIKIELTKN